jgi:hypothetical protein
MVCFGQPDRQLSSAPDVHRSESDRSAPVDLRRSQCGRQEPETATPGTFSPSTSDIHSSVTDQPIALLKWRKLDKAVVEGEPFKRRLPTEAASRKFAEAVNAQCKVWN